MIQLILFESQENILNWEKRFFLREKCIALIILSVVDNAINICKNKKIIKIIKNIYTQDSLSKFNLRSNDELSPFKININWTSSTTGTKYIHIIFEIGRNKNSLNRKLKLLFPIVSNTKKEVLRESNRSKNPFPSFQISSSSVFLREIEILTNTSSRTKYTA